MNSLSKYWTTLLFHAFVALAAALLFLFGPEIQPENPLLFVAIPLFLVVLAQILLWWKSNWTTKDWLTKISLILVDLFLAFWILYEPMQSMRIFLVVLGLWSVLLAVLLFWNYRQQAGLRAALVLSGFLFLVVSGYLFWQSTKAESADFTFLGIVLCAFSFFLILIALQLRAKMKKAEAAKIAGSAFNAKTEG